MLSQMPGRACIECRRNRRKRIVNVVNRRQRGAPGARAVRGTDDVDDAAEPASGRQGADGPPQARRSWCHFRLAQQRWQLRRASCLAADAGGEHVEWTDRRPADGTARCVLCPVRHGHPDQVESARRDLRARSIRCRGAIRVQAPAVALYRQTSGPCHGSHPVPARRDPGTLLACHRSPRWVCLYCRIAQCRQHSVLRPVQLGLAR